MTGINYIKMPGSLRKGSLTVEASIAFPIFLWFVLGLMYILLIFRLEDQISQCLTDTGKELGVLAGVTSEAAAQAAAHPTLLYNKSKYVTDEVALSFVDGGIDGISFLRSHLLFNNHKFELIATYDLKTPWYILTGDTIHILQKQTCRAFVGFDSDEGNTEETGDMVYVTPHGSVYHSTSSCKYLDLSIRAVAKSDTENLRNADGSIYYACHCVDKNYRGDVYITNYGDRYHQDRQCSKLKRTVEMVLKDNCGSKTPCKGCCGG